MSAQGPEPITPRPDESEDAAFDEMRKRIHLSQNPPPPPKPRHNFVPTHYENAMRRDKRTELTWVQSAFDYAARKGWTHAAFVVGFMFPLTPIDVSGDGQLQLWFNKVMMNRSPYIAEARYFDRKENAATDPALRKQFREKAVQARKDFKETYGYMQEFELIVRREYHLPGARNLQRSAPT